MTIACSCRVLSDKEIRVVFDQIVQTYGPLTDQNRSQAKAAYYAEMIKISGKNQGCCNTACWDDMVAELATQTATSGGSLGHTHTA